MELAQLQWKKLDTCNRAIAFQIGELETLEEANSSTPQFANESFPRNPNITAPAQRPAAPDPHRRRHRSRETLIPQPVQQSQSRTAALRPTRPASRTGKQEPKRL